MADVRVATLDDTRAITELACARIPKWQRLTAQGQVEDLPYERLSIYERWLHGGAWLSLETGAIWLSHLLHGAGTPLVLTEAGRVLGYAELYTGSEPSPYGAHVHLGEVLLAADAPDEAAEALMNTIFERATKIGRVLAAGSAYDTERAALYERFGLQSLLKVQFVTVSAQTGVGFYKATEHSDPNPAQIADWGMPVGRTHNARQQWEQLWVSHWDAVPQIMAQKTHRLKFSASGQDAYVCFQEKLFEPRTVDVYCWTPKPLSQQLLLALRDRAHKQGYRSLMMGVTDKVAAFIGTDAESAPGLQEIFCRDLR